MSEETKAVVSNPFEEEAFVEGGGLWSGKTVTITRARAVIDLFRNGDGTPWIDPKTKEQGKATVLEVIGIADDEEKERRETYSVGNLEPTADGLGFQRPDGTPGAFHSKSQIASFAHRIKEGGFDVSVLFVDGRQNVSKLEGARFVFVGEPQLDAKGNEKVNKKGYKVEKFWPSKFVGFKAGGGTVASSSGVASDALKARATEVILGLIAGAGGTISRAELVRALGSTLKGDPDVNKIITLTTKDDFHKSAPWVRTGTGFSLGA